MLIWKLIISEQSRLYPLPAPPSLQHALDPTLHLGELRLSIVHSSMEMQGSWATWKPLECIIITERQSPLTVPLMVIFTRHPLSSAVPLPFPRFLYQTAVMKSTSAYGSSLLGTSCLVFPLGHGWFIIPGTGLRFPRLPYSTYQKLTLLTLDVTYISLSKSSGSCSLQPPKSYSSLYTN